MVDLAAFLLESNKIEGIVGARPAELDAAEAFLRLPDLSIGDVIRFVAATQPGAVLRDRASLDVCVGDYRPPHGGPAVAHMLASILAWINDSKLTPFEAHRDYESLHPFTDGNGRSGRMIWLWQMLRDGRGVSLGFLHTWYYQSLAAR